jgi:hypothetical protein
MYLSHPNDSNERAPTIDRVRNEMEDAISIESLIARRRDNGGEICHPRERERDKSNENEKGSFL